MEELTPLEMPAASTSAFRGSSPGAGAGIDIDETMVRLRDDTGEIVGTALITKPAVGMAVLTRDDVRR